MGFSDNGNVIVNDNDVISKMKEDFKTIFYRGRASATVTVTVTTTRVHERKAGFKRGMSFSCC